VVERSRVVTITPPPYDVEIPAPDAGESPQERLGAALLALRQRAPKAPLSKLYDRHRDKLERL
jgi:hypothetical protein